MSELTDGLPCPKIGVRRWNGRRVYVRCPYCKEEHRHRFALLGRRVSSHCAGGQYEFILPIDESSGLVGYEIDKRGAYFVNASLQMGQTDEDLPSSESDDSDDGELADDFGSRMRISVTEPTPEPGLNPDGDSRKVDIMSDGFIFEQKKMEAAISDYVPGKCGAISRYLSISAETNLFLHGRNEMGDTTLITAASERSLNAEKRHAYTGPLSETQQNDYCFRKSPSEMTITFLGPIQSYRVPHMGKTVAVLERGSQFGAISGTSGWRSDALPLNYTTGPSWTEKVFYISSTIGHEFQVALYPSWDQGKPGQFNACHAEKKLIAYFLDKHVFLPQDREPDPTLEDSTRHKALMELSRNEPAFSLRQAVILSSSQICDDCDNFKEKVNDYFGVNICLKWAV